MASRFEVSEGADGLLRIGSGAHTHLKLSREDAGLLINDIAERLHMPPVKVARVPLWRRFVEWLGRKARVRRQLERDAMYERLARKYADQYGMRE